MPEFIWMAVINQGIAVLAMLNVKASVAIRVVGVAVITFLVQIVLRLADIYHLLKAGVA